MRRSKCRAESFSAAQQLDTTYRQQRQPMQSTKAQRVVVLGGTGRVGGSTASALLSGKDADQLVVQVAGRSRENYHTAAERRPDLTKAEFLRCDIDDLASVKAAIQGADLVIHAAGPFQRKGTCTVLQAAIELRTPYMDVCDDVEYTEQTKLLHQKAVDAGVPCITSAGIYPGVSNLMAAHMVALARKEVQPEYLSVSSSGATSTPADNSGSSRSLPVEPKRVRYFYYTAGSGGVGTTILETSFLLAGTDVEVYVDGKMVKAPPISNREVVDFGKGIGSRSAYLYNLPEVHSTHKCLGVPSVSARFSTAPEFWNWAMWLVARLAPKGFLQDREKSKWLAKLSMPAVKFIDPIVGEKVGMLVHVELEDNSTAAGIFVHKELSVSVGICLAAFARNMLAGGTKPGVWFPEEAGAVADRRAVLREAAAGCDRFEMNRPPWALERDPVRIGLGFYW